MAQSKKQRTHEKEVVGWNLGTIYWMGVSDASYYIHKIMKIKVAEWGKTKKNIKKSKPI